MPLVSIFTPSHQPRFLDETLDSILGQTFSDWEWVVLLNGGSAWRPLVADPRVRVVRDDDVVGVGAAKRAACALTTGEILVEVDHDDLLHPEALSEIVAAFAGRPEASLVYSHCAQILEDGSRDDSRFAASAGWEYREETILGRDLVYPVALTPTPHNVSYIWFAPNHVRAFRRAAYETVGGYDATRTVLDDQDLMCRLYAVGDFHLIDRCLYLQRMHRRNTQRENDTNAFIQQETVALYDRYAESNALAWAGRAGLAALDLGAAHNARAGYVGVDQYAAAAVGIVATLPGALPLEAGSVGVIRAVDFLEHVVDKIGLINELHRLLAPGGMLLSLTPSTDGRGAFQDPTHVAFYNENSFWYYTDVEYARFVPQLTARFQQSRLTTVFPSEWHQQHDISYVYANLVCLKGEQPRNGGALRW